MARFAILAFIPAASAFGNMQNSTLAQLDPNRILCPVLASLWKTGALVSDNSGISERAQIKSALKDGTGCVEHLSEFQSAGIAGFDWTHKYDQSSRDRCLPGLTLSGSHCWAKWLRGSKAEDVKRYLNIFEMNGLEVAEHGVSTGVRGGNCNSPAANDLCNGVYPCEALFQKFYVAHASNGRIYLDNIKQIICHAMAEGDRGGEFAYQDGDVGILGLEVKLPARQWQMKAAMIGWLSAFGRADGNGKLYFTIDDARAMIMEGRVPDGWSKRNWGCITPLIGSGCPTMPDGSRDLSIVEQATMELPCDQYGEWWKPAEPYTTTGQSCNRDWDCSDSHSLCLSKRCTCVKGRNGLQMHFKGGKCREQGGPRKYNGGTCKFNRANNPDAPNTWDSTAIEV